MQLNRGDKTTITIFCDHRTPVMSSEFGDELEWDAAALVELQEAESQASTSARPDVDIEDSVPSSASRRQSLYDRFRRHRGALAVSDLSAPTCKFDTISWPQGSKLTSAKQGAKCNTRSVISRESNYIKAARFDPGSSTGCLEEAIFPSTDALRP
jgi:hypothetical protein